MTTRAQHFDRDCYCQDFTPNLSGLNAAFEAGRSVEPLIKISEGTVTCQAFGDGGHVQIEVTGGNPDVGKALSAVILVAGEELRHLAVGLTCEIGDLASEVGEAIRQLPHHTIEVSISLRQTCIILRSSDEEAFILRNQPGSLADALRSAVLTERHRLSIRDKAAA